MLLTLNLGNLKAEVIYLSDKHQLDNALIYITSYGMHSHGWLGKHKAERLSLTHLFGIGERERLVYEGGEQGVREVHDIVVVGIGQEIVA